MNAAPDLDWLLDLLPVDFAADAITRLVLDFASKELRCFHLANPNARNWRELILWMNLYGYDMQLIPYEHWLVLLKDDVRRTKDHPLRDLLPFFSDRPDRQNSLYLPQLYEEPRRRKVRFDATREHLHQAGLRCPRLSTRLLDRYFQSYVNRGFLPPGQERMCQGDSRPAFDESLFRDISGMDVIGAEPLEFAAANSVIGELTSWKYGRSIGLHRYRLQFARPSRECDVVVKVKARDTDVTAVGQTVAALCGSALGTAYQIYSDCLGLSDCDSRELAMYQQQDVRFRRFTPEFFGGKAANDRTVLILEDVSGLEMMDSVDSIHVWDAGYVVAAIKGLAQLHAIHFGRLSSASTDNRFIEAISLWTALAEHAAPIFSQWIGSEVRSIQAALLKRATDIGTLRQRQSATWIHNDFNPRNLGFRRVDNESLLCAYDWELATVGLPQHDLAELLCFVLPAEVDEHALFHYIDFHRTELEAASGLRIDDSSWKLGFGLSLYDLMINRLPAYAMIHHFNQQRFLERVVRTWKGLFDVVSSAVSPLF
jgi:hypothetical protein